MRDLFNLLNAISSGPAPVVEQTKVSNFVVSTINSIDQGYETAILTKNNTYPVERYIDLPFAKNGHIRWVEKMKNPPRILTELGYGSSIDDREVELIPMSDEQYNNFIPTEPEEE